MKTLKNISAWFMLFALMSGSAFMASCSDSDTESVTPQVTLGGTAPIYYTASQRFIQVQANGDWTLDLKFVAEETPWCTLSQTSGSGSKNVILSITENDTENSRFTTVVLVSEGITTLLDLEQYDASYTDTPPVTPTIKYVDQMLNMPAWMELPVATKPYLGQSAVVTHGNMVNGKYVRNYTMLFDTTKFLAYWVAYPISADYLGDLNRPKPDPWAYDPKIPAEYQAGIVKGGYPDKSEPGPYDRGHQLRSDERSKSMAENIQTFYASNQTAQVSYFNQLLWLTLENKVQGYANLSDTLYVVTGAHLGPNYLTTLDRSVPAKQIPVPTHYYKVLVSYKLIGGVKTYKSIGFWFENKVYPNVLNSSYAKPVTEIETLTGFKFFPNLPNASIKSEFKPGDWGL